MIFDKSLLRDFDKTLFITMFLISVFGLFILTSATQAKGLEFNESYVLRQMNWMAIGTILLLIVLNVSYQKFVDISYILYAANLLLLILVLVLSPARLGAQRWFSIGTFTFQPSEFIKLTLILAASNYVGSKRESITSLRNFFISLVLLAVPVALVLIQPDLGTALLLLPIFLSILLVGGASSKHIIGLVLSGLAMAPFLWNFLREYQRQRLLVFINPNVDPLGAGYTIIQSKIAIGSGGIFGRGWLAGTQNQLNFLPERHTDFIYSVVGEEWGIVGALGLIFLYLIIVMRAFNIASSTSDIYGKLIALGIAVMLSFEILINIGMTIGLMPVVGIPLPLVSYGGSSLVTTFVAVGLLLNIGMRRVRY